VTTETADSAAQTPVRSLGDRAYGVLRERIIGLVYAPGQRLIERDLAAELQLSRIPLREAMQRLQNDGLVIAIPRQGAIVSPFTADDVRDLFDVRESLEVLAFRLAAERADQASLATLRRHVADAFDATSRADDAGIAAANAAFHRTVVEMAANPLLTSMMGPLEARVAWLFHLTRQRDPIQQCQEHQELYEALAAHDVPRAEHHAFAHVHSGRDLSIELARTWSIDTIDPVAATRTRRR
jgi:DNA-binding GntR family transcriptional regulator